VACYPEVSWRQASPTTHAVRLLDDFTIFQDMVIADDTHIVKLKIDLSNQPGRGVCTPLIAGRFEHL